MGRVRSDGVGRFMLIGKERYILARIGQTRRSLHVWWSEVRGSGCDGAWCAVGRNMIDATIVGPGRVLIGGMGWFMLGGAGRLMIRVVMLVVKV